MKKITVITKKTLLSKTVHRIKLTLKLQKMKVTFQAVTKILLLL